MSAITQLPFVAHRPQTENQTAHFAHSPVTHVPTTPPSLSARNITDQTFPHLNPLLASLTAAGTEQLREEISRQDEFSPENPRRISFSQEEKSLLVQFLEILSRIYEQDRKLKEKDRQELESLKVTFRESVNNQGEFFTKMGRSGLLLSGIALCVTLGSFATPNEPVKTILQQIASQVPSAQAWFQNGYLKDQKGEAGKETLSLNALQAEQQKKQTESTRLESPNQALQSLLQGYVQAARPM